jgi:hypothetical protein
MDSDPMPGMGSESMLGRSILYSCAHTCCSETSELNKSACKALTTNLASRSCARDVDTVEVGRGAPSEPSPRWPLRRPFGA